MWTVKSNGAEYTALGYEKRGLWNVPVADIVNGEYISCTVYEIIHGIANENAHISVTRPNNTELSLLNNSGWSYDGCFAFKE